MTTCLENTYSVGLLCVSFVNFCQLVCFLPFGVEGRMWDMIVFVPDRRFSSYLTAFKK